MSANKPTLKKFKNLKKQGYKMGGYSWTKATAQKRADSARKKGYNVRVMSAQTTVARRTGYTLWGKKKK